MADSKRKKAAREKVDPTKTYQLEDALGQLEQINLPGTVDQYRNWCRKLPATIENWTDLDGIQLLFNRLRQLRRDAFAQPG